MLRASNFPPITSPGLSVLRLSLIPNLNFSSKPSNLHNFVKLAPLHNNTSLPKPLIPSSSYLRSTSFRIMGHPCFNVKASYSSASGDSSEGSREILVQHLLVKEDDPKLIVELQKRIIRGEDLSDLAVEYSICPSSKEGGMLGWVRKGQMVPEFEEAAFSSALNKVVRCKTKFGWHLLQVLSEREQPSLQEIDTSELHVKMQDPNFLEEVQLIDVREHDEVAKASLSGFQVLPLRQFGSWGPEITTNFDPQKDTYVMCHHGMRSLQVAKWLQTQGFRRVYNVTGGIHAYATQVDNSIPTY